MLPVSGEQHEKAIDAAVWEETFELGRIGYTAAEAAIAAYFASLAAQGVRLVDVSGDRLVTLTVCARSGQLPHECGLVACDNGCETEDLEFVRVDGSAVEGVRLVAVSEVAEWLLTRGRGNAVELRYRALAESFLARFGGGDA